MNKQIKKLNLQRRHRKIRTQIKGTPKRPRLSVYRSLDHIYAQLIDDASGKTVAAADDRQVKATDKGKMSVKVSQAYLVGQLVAQKAVAAGIKSVVFDRSGYKYHGRVKALAEGARQAGLNF